MSVASLTIGGKRFVVLPENEYERMRELARELADGNGPETLCRIEKGKSLPDSTTFQRIHRALERAERDAAE